MADGGSNSIADQDTVSFNSIDPVPEHDLTSDSAPGYLGLFDLKNARPKPISKEGKADAGETKTKGKTLSDQSTSGIFI